MRPARIGLAIALTGFAAACGGNEAAGPGIALSREEVIGLASELGDAIRTVAVPGLDSGLLDGAAPCRNGGSATSAGSYAGADTVIGDATVTLSACRTTSYTASGPLHVTATVAGVRSATTTVTVHVTGTLQVSAADGRSGSCAVDVGAATAASGTATSLVQVSGTACGVNVSGRY